MKSKYLVFNLKNQANYKNIFTLSKYINSEGKILPKRLNQLSAKKQRKISKAIKNARMAGFLPFIRISVQN